MINKNGKEKIKVAWYENNMQFVEPILYYLKKEKVFEVKIFGTPDTAEEEIADFKPDLIIFDYRMELFNGIQMFKKMKDKGLEFVPMFFSIWAKDESTKVEILEAGVEEEAILDKHMEPSSLPKRLRDYYLKTRRK